jgi:hypothetical protein
LPGIGQGLRHTRAPARAQVANELSGGHVINLLNDVLGSAAAIDGADPTADAAVRAE